MKNAGAAPRAVSHLYFSVLCSALTIPLFSTLLPPMQGSTPSFAGRCLWTPAPPCDPTPQPAAPAFQSFSQLPVWVLSWRPWCVTGCRLSTGQLARVRRQRRGPRWRACRTRRRARRRRRHAARRWQPPQRRPRLATRLGSRPGVERCSPCTAARWAPRLRCWRPAGQKAAARWRRRCCRRRCRC